MVVDESTAIRSMLRMILRSAGFEVLEAKDGRDALDRLNQQGTMDIALVDWNMPEMNGLEFLRSVRAQPLHDSMRIVMVTTESEISQVTRALSEGANEYAMKPFTRESILEKLELLGFGRPA